MPDGNSKSSFDQNKLASVLSNSYSPFSNFKVASCIESVSGNFYYGCNVENSTIGATVCAERTALVKMISDEGKNAKIKKVYVLSQTEEPITPCGICRQSLFEFVDVGFDPEIECISKDFKQKKVFKLSYLFPEGFKLQ